MKTLQLMIAFAVTLMPLKAATQETIQERLVRVELDYAAAVGSGRGPQHPKVQGLKAELDVLNQTPGIRNERYWELVNEKKIMLNAELARLTAEGRGSTNPQVQSVTAELAAIESIQKKS